MIYSNFRIKKSGMKDIRTAETLNFDTTPDMYYCKAFKAVIPVQNAYWKTLYKTKKKK